MFRKLFLMSLILLLAFGLVACAEDEPVADDPVDEVDVVEDEVDEEVTDEDEWDAIIEAAQEEGRVVVYSSGDPRFEEPAMDIFEEMFGITVEYARPGGGEVVTRQIETEKTAGQNLVDVVTLTDETLAIYLHDNDWARVVGGNVLPNSSNYLPEFQQDEYYFFPAYILPMPIMYNSELVAEDEVPETYYDLTDPRWDGNITFGQPENAGSVVATIYAFQEMYGWDFIEQLKENNLSETRLSGESALRIAQGEMEIGVIPSIWALQQVFEGFPVELYFPENLVTTKGVSVVMEDSPNPNAALLMQNFMLSEDWLEGWDNPAVGVWFPFDMETVADQHLPDDPDLYEFDLNDFFEKRLDVIEKWREIMG